MFKPVSDAASGRSVSLLINGDAYHVPAQVTVASAVLMTIGAASYRRTEQDEPRAPLCMMGVCHECRVTINGLPNQQGCLVAVEDGMAIETAGYGDATEGRAS